MKLTRTSLGLAVRAARGAAQLTLSDLAAATELTVSSLSRTEHGERDLGFGEASLIAEALKIDVETLRSLAETFERAGAADKKSASADLARDLNELQRVAIEAVIEARLR